jgi:large subunit ribosomal protein L4
MFKARYYKTDGSKGRARALPDALFDGVVNEGVLHQAVKVYLSNQRQGTAAAKNRSAVAGGSRKPWRQKGTGRARQGTIRAAQWTGGGMAFPPQPHSWRQKLPKKVRSLARRSAFNARAEDERVILVDRFGYDEPKTARLRDYLQAIEADGKVLILTHGQNPNLFLSARNLQNVLVREFGSESVYDILWAGSVLIEREALDNLGADEAAPAEEKAEAPKAKAKTKKAPKAEAAPEAVEPEEAPEASSEEAETAAPEAAEDEEAKDA